MATAARDFIEGRVMIDLVDIKRQIEMLGDRLGKTQDYL
jgi:hypothetical protein